jgi:hypothetical protein
MSDPDPLPEVKAAHSHLFPGARLILDNIEPAQFAASGDRMLVSFQDGSSALAELLFEPSGELSLAVEPYETAAGTSLPKKIWRLRAITTTPDDHIEMLLGYGLTVTDQ